MKKQLFTHKPLALDGRTMAASVKGIHESRSGDIHPHASFIIGDKTSDNRLGALFSMVYSRKTLRADTYRASGFDDDDDDEDAFLNVDMNGDGVLSDDERFPSQIPMYMYFANAQDVRTRICSSLALQWQPTVRLDLNLDAWGGPAWHAAYGQLDASLSYDINNKVTVFAEASNLTNNSALH